MKISQIPFSHVSYKLRNFARRRSNHSLMLEERIIENGVKMNRDYSENDERL